MKSVLICDDEPIIRSGLKACLARLGFETIIECSDGAAAVKAALDSIPDLAILDVSMPKKDGITAAAEIRQRLKLPIVFLTACHDPETIERAKKIGIASFLLKPLREQDLWPAIEMACAHNEVVEELKEQVEDLKETLETRKVIEKAKGVLMKARGLDEEAAYGAMRKLAMARGQSLVKVARDINDMATLLL